MTNDDRDVLHHLKRAEGNAGEAESFVVEVVYHVGAAIALALLQIANAIREKPVR